MICPSLLTPAEILLDVLRGGWRILGDVVQEPGHDRVHIHPEMVAQIVGDGQAVGDVGLAGFSHGIAVRRLGKSVRALKQAQLVAVVALLQFVVDGLVLHTR